MAPRRTARNAAKSEASALVDAIDDDRKLIERTLKAMAKKQRRLAQLLSENRLAQDAENDASREAKNTRAVEQKTTDF